MRRASKETMTMEARLERAYREFRPQKRGVLNPSEMEELGRILFDGYKGSLQELRNEAVEMFCRKHELTFPHIREEYEEYWRQHDIMSAITGLIDARMMGLRR